MAVLSVITIVVGISPMIQGWDLTRGDLALTAESIVLTYILSHCARFESREPCMYCNF
jgi:hypothetical protein